MISVTTDIDVAKRYAGSSGQVYTAVVPKSSLVRQTIEGATESEMLIINGIGGITKWPN